MSNVSEYILANKFSPYRNAIAIVGCGGTGGFAAEGIARLLQGAPQFHLRLVDGDRVEERNLLRQNFYPEDLGQFKSQALAERLARRYGQPIGYSLEPLPEREPYQGGILDGCGLVLGCVDTALARAAIARLVSPSRWWVDAGNGSEFGQVLVGNARKEELRGAFDKEKGLCHALPLPTLVRPELLVPVPRQDRSCADPGAEQGPFINQWMGILVVEVVRRLLEGRLQWWQLYLDLEAGSLRTVRPTPEAVSRVTGVRLKQLVRKGGEP